MKTKGIEGDELNLSGRAQSRHRIPNLKLSELTRTRIRTVVTATR